MKTFMTLALILVYGTLSIILGQQVIKPDTLTERERLLLERVGWLRS